MMALADPLLLSAPALHRRAEAAHSAGVPIGAMLCPLAHMKTAEATRLSHARCVCGAYSAGAFDGTAPPQAAAGAIRQPCAWGLVYVST